MFSAETLRREEKQKNLMENKNGNMTNIVDVMGARQYNECTDVWEESDMLADLAQKYFLEGDYNCAESLLLAANEYYALGLDSENCYRLVSAFGGGMGCGSVCGALAGGIAALGQMTVDGRAHTTQDFKENCASFVAEFEAALGSQLCRDIKPALFEEGKRCAEAVRRGADVLEKHMQARGFKKA